MFRRIVITTIIIIALALPTGLQAADAAPGKSAAELFAAGKQAYEAQDYARALSLLQESFKLAPEPMDTSLYLGMAARKLGNFETAVMAFDRMLIRDPKLPRVRYELARTYFEMGLIDMAFKQTQALPDAKELPDAVRRDLADIIRQIKRQRQEHTFAGYLTLSVGYDTNPLGNPQQDFRIPGFDAPLTSEVPHDWLLGQSLIMDHEYRPLRSSTAIATRLVEYCNWHDKLQQQDLRYLYIKSGPRRYFEKSRLDLQLSASGMQKDEQNYLHTFGFEPAYLQQLNPNLWLDSALRLEQRQFSEERDARYDSTNARLRIGPVRRWGKNTLGMYLAAEENWADVDAESYDKVGVELFASRELLNWITLYASVDCDHSNYQDINTIESDVARRDTTYTGKTGLILLLSDAWTMDLSCRYQEVHSNVELRTYDRLTTGLSVTYKF